MFEVSLIKCINCNIFYEPDNFFEKDIKNMRENYKLIYCKKCISDNEYINKKKKIIFL